MVLDSSPFPSFNHTQSQEQDASNSTLNVSDSVDSLSMQSRGAPGDTLAPSFRVPTNKMTNPQSSLTNSTATKGPLGGASIMHERILRMKKLQADQPHLALQSTTEIPSPWANEQIFVPHSHTATNSFSHLQNESASRPVNKVARPHASEPQDQSNFEYPLRSHGPSVGPPILSRSPSASMTRSRSGSADLNNRALPAVLAEALQSVENWNSDNQSMRSTIDRLESDLQAAITEKEHLDTQKKALENRLAISKSTAIASLKESSAKLESMRAELDSFKATSTHAVASATGMHQVTTDVSTLKATSEQALEFVKSLFDQDGNCNFKSSETKELIANLGQEISELSRDCDNKQQVINLLREKLEITTGELVEQKERGDTIEAKQAHNTEEFHRLIESLYRREDDAARLHACRQELMTALTHAGDMENQVRALNNRNIELNDIMNQRAEAARSDIANLKSQIAAGTELASEQTQKLSALEMELHDVSKSHEVLHKQLEQARDEESSLRAKVETLETCAAEVQMLRVIQVEAACIPDLRSQLHTLLSANSTLEARVQELQVEQTEMARLRGVEGSFVALTESTAELRRKMEVLTASHIAAKEECARETALKDAAEARLVSTIENFESSIDALKEKLHVSMSQNLRLELQAETLGQERVLQSANFDTLESRCTAKENEIVSLRSCIIEHERRAAADDQRLIQMEKLNIDYADVRQQLALAAAKFALSQKSVEDLTAAQMTLNMKLSSSVALDSDLQRQLAEAQTLSQAALDECRRVHEDEKAKARSELAQASAQTDLAHEEIERLRSTVATLEAALRDASDAMNSFESRYNAGGQMSKPECAVVQAIMRHCQRSVEEQLVAKGNEIRRRDNTIKALEGRVKSIESLLAKQLDNKAKADASAGITKRSLIDVNNWLSSSPDGPSVPDNVTANVHDKDSVAPAFLYSDHEPVLPEPAIPSAPASTDKHPSPKPPINRANVDTEIDNNSHLPERTQFTPTARSSMKRRRQVTSENIALVPNSTALKRAVRTGDTTLDVCVEISD
ncbi:hypothetical protein BS47DRAFT_476824 [Hydnum rufescens UP504]|uniref:Uncharacterized protein n=1 Tax=Hydnum rufescens UP504 TaxID=1448309 RepID=A0A9P6B540_9AGAM|nr:hypothetical protein BS47DRAFT_476824 [Hydnum rufescens UP504]